ncbi:putative metalloprotease CJM1_0395 family protein [Sulfuricurvum sp.]|uniref:putative metalloprotease CJM1_0395 family protein n=1 Tax=Sulfuricurvum sp. TaxID=2025608 RepID=UPI002637C8EA|nr:putative metalloprotease CJM1_0395 family protein [Sulfuricurvum sp.]MDD4884181.1 putative metalloprotease CJM1_0395 family protein [Sulfuricurvum sp.]
MNIQVSSSYSPYVSNTSDHNTQSNVSSTAKSSSSAQALISKLASTDTKVRAHEAAHIAAGGGVVSGGANFSYTKGPDGKMYATAGEVPIDTSEGKTPEETIQKARQIAAAAMAPSDPSPQDYRVAASAAVMEMRGHLEENKKIQETINGQKAYGSVALSEMDPSSAEASS